MSLPKTRFDWLSIGSVLVLCLGAWWLFATGNAHDPINAFMLEQRKVCQSRPNGCPTLGGWSASLVPAVFAPGAPRSDVLKRLHEAGYTAVEEDLYRRSWSLNWGCDSNFFVILQFDPGGGLMDAEASDSASCL